MKYLLTLFCFIAPTIVNAASFTYEGKSVTSTISSKSISCDSYNIDLIDESFPFKYERHIPNEFSIKGFYGSRAIISKLAIIHPTGIVIPNANDIPELKGIYPADRTYLPGSVVCQGNNLLVSYWSGGNCSQCEAFVAFEYSGSKLINPKTVTPNNFKTMSK